MTAIMREPKGLTEITISNVLTNCTAIAKQQFAGGSIGLQASTTLSTLSVYASHDGTNFGPIYDQYGDPVTITITSGSERVFPELPDAIYKFPFIKLKDAANEETASVFLTS